MYNNKTLIRIDSNILINEYISYHTSFPKRKFPLAIRSNMVVVLWQNFLTQIEYIILHYGGIGWPNAVLGEKANYVCNHDLREYFYKFPI